MKSPTLFATILALGLAVTLGAARPTWGGPYIRTSIEYSVASSQRQCEGQVVGVFRNLEGKRRLSVDRNNRRLAWTKNSTMYVECIFVGRSEQRRKQWIFYISIASTDGPESAKLLKLLRRKLGSIVPID